MYAIRSYYELGAFREQDQLSFQHLVAEAIHEIKSGSCQKIVTSRRESVMVNELDWVKTFQKMTVLYPSAFKYCFFHPGVGMWMGASPEQLLKTDGKKIKTVALAGTRLQSTTDEAWGQKEVVEQHRITSYNVCYTKLLRFHGKRIFSCWNIDS